MKIPKMRRFVTHDIMQVVGGLSVGINHSNRAMDWL